jgi:hypothetical protein
MTRPPLVGAWISLQFADFRFGSQSRHFYSAPLTSGLLRLADILSIGRHVSNVPKPEVGASPEHLPNQLARVQHDVEYHQFRLWFELWRRRQ